MKKVFIISSGQIYQGRSAGSQRVMNIAKSLAAGSVSVFLVSYSSITSHPVESEEIFPGIYNLANRNKKGNSLLHMIRFLSTVSLFAGEKSNETVIYLYPTIFTLKDFIYLFYFKIIKRYKFYCDINELRVAKAFVFYPQKRILLRVYSSLKAIYLYISYKLSELQVLLYDGIVVISTNLEKYFSRYTRRILRVPILCDIPGINVERHPIKYDSTVFRICFAGYIRCEKEGFDILFEAIHRVNLKKNVELFLYGIIPDEDKQMLADLEEKFQLQNKIFYVGNIDPDALLREFSKYHLLILPRPLNLQTKYGFSTKLSEYMVAGVPVLVTDVSDNAIYIKDGHNGYIIPPGSRSAMAGKIFEIIENYNQNSDFIVENALLTAREKFDYKLHTYRLIDFLFKAN
jgi:glycosyltransferase involved in cell wall biosynthesis